MSLKQVTKWADKVERGEPLVTKFLYNITAAKTVTQQEGNASLVLWDAVSSQAVIDTFLGTSSEFLAAGFAATPMGTDAFGAILDFQGQVDTLLKVVVKLMSGTNFSTVVETSSVPDTALTATLVTSSQKGSSGNVAFHAILGGVDILTAGQIEVSVYWRSK